MLRPGTTWREVVSQRSSLGGLNQFDLLFCQLSSNYSAWYANRRPELHRLPPRLRLDLVQCIVATPYVA